MSQRSTGSVRVERMPRRSSVFGALVIVLFGACGTGASTSSPTVSPAVQPSAPVGQTAISATTRPVEPSRARQVYVVRPGDSLAGIAKRFGVSVDALLAENPAIDDPDVITVGEGIQIPDVPWRPLVIETAIAEGPFEPGDRHVMLDEPVTVRVTADATMAEEMIAWYTDWQPGSPFDWTEYASDAIERDGSASHRETSDAPVRVAWQARVAATASHGELWSDAVIVEWGGTGPCPASALASGWRAVSPDSTVFEIVEHADDDLNTRVDIVASDLKGVPRTGWRHELESCWRPMGLVFAGDGTAFLTVLGLPYSEYARDAVVLVFGPESSTPRASIPTSGSYGSGGPGMFLSTDGTVYMFTYDGEYDANVFRSLSLTAFDSAGRPKPGWPYTSTQRGSDPVFGPDGTVYLSFWHDDGDRIVALDPSGSMRPGWPFLLRANSTIQDNRSCPPPEMCAVAMIRPASPTIEPDGTIVVTTADTVYRINPDGTLALD